MRLAVFCWAVAVAQLDVSAADLRPVDVTFEDLRAGYRQNYEQFRTLQVAWRFRRQNHENAWNRIRKATASEPEEQRNELIKAWGDREEQIQFFTDRTGIQIRTPYSFAENRDAVGQHFPFPEAPPHAETLASSYARFAVYNYSGTQSDGILFWDGVLNQRPNAAIASVLNPDLPGAVFPPLGYPKSFGGFVGHPIDEFFSQQIDDARVVGYVALDGRETVLVEKSFIDPSYTRAMHHFVAETGGKSELFSAGWIDRAWIDVEQGCLPVRLERIAQWSYDGSNYRDPQGYGAFRVIECLAVNAVQGAGYYPVHVRRTDYAPDANDASTPPSLMDVVHGKTPTRRQMLPDSEIEWIADELVANRDMSGMFDLGFPDGMSYMDYRDSTVKGRSYDDDAKLLAKTAMGRSRREPGPLPPGGANPALLLLANVVLALGIAGIVAYRRLGAKRGGTANPPSVTMK